MKKFLSYLVLVVVLVGCSSSFANAQKWSGTYVINGITVEVNASHKNQLGQYADGGSMDTKKLANTYYGLALKAKSKTFSYSNLSSCGNTTAYSLKILSCTVTNKCSADGAKLTTRSATCKTTTTECPCGGCVNGACKVCPGDEEPVDILEEPVEEPVEDPVFDILTCTEDVWECGDWSSCNVDTRSRSCLMLFDCPNADTPSPTLTESCVPGEVTVPNCPYPAADGSCPPPTISFTANPNIVSKGGSCNLNWKVSNADACEINNVSVSPTTGVRSTGPLQVPKIYKMTCTNGPASSASEVQLCSVQDVIEY